MTSTLGLVGDLNVPRNGWELVEVEDLNCDEADFALCQWCARKHVRYVHHLRHERHEGTVGVGCMCAEKMQRDPGALYVGRDIEKELVNRAKRRAKWLTRKWRTTKNGNLRLTLKEVVFVILQRPYGWEAKLKLPNEQQWRSSSRPLATDAEAKLLLFDAMWPAKLRAHSA